MATFEFPISRAEGKQTLVVLFFETSIVNANLLSSNDITNLESNFPWITLVNGYSRTHRDFKNLTKTLNKNGFNVLTLDNRGVGQTLYPRPEVETDLAFTLFDLANDIIKLWDHLKIEKSSILGISMGGHICQQLATHFSPRISKMALISTCSKNVTLFSRREAWPLHNLELMKERMNLFFSPKNAEKYQLLIHSMVRDLMNGASNSQIQKGFDDQAQCVAEYMNSELSKVKIDSKLPTLVIHGREDRIIELTLGIDLLKEIPSAHGIFYAGMGHLLLVECPAQLSKDLVSFFQAQ